MKNNHRCIHNPRHHTVAMKQQSNILRYRNQILANLGKTKPQQQNNHVHHDMRKSV